MLFLNRTRIYFYFILFLTSKIYSQKIIKGTVYGGKKNKLEGVLVSSSNTNYTYTNSEGEFILSLKDSLLKRLTFYNLGYKKKTIDIPSFINGEIKVILIEDVVKINEVVIQSKTKEEKIEEKSFTVKSIDVKKLKNKSTDASQILNASSGIRIRTQAGFGSKASLSLNGLTNNQIRVFMDDIPIDELGEAYQLHNIPVNVIERIDVYKGVVPAKLGADALGGAINIITDQKKTSFIHTSYGSGSFNTHKFTFNSRYKSNKSGFTAKLSTIYNYSDNDYTMYDVKYFTGTPAKEVQKNVDRFHDTFKSFSIDAGLGYTNTKWADKLMLHANSTNTDREIQGLISRPIGEATETESNKTFRLNYAKSNVLNTKLSVNTYALYNHITSTQIDTTSNRYRWDGSFITNPSIDDKGELLREKTIFKFKQKQFQYRINLNYNINNNNTLNLNHISTTINRRGENEYFSNRSQAFQAPNELTKKVTGLEYSSNFLDKKLQNTIAVKYYHFNMLAREAITYNDQSIGINDIETTQRKTGYSLSSRYFILPNLLIKASFEKGYRIPLPKEIFGDGLGTLANPNLQSEISENLNIGIRHKTDVFNNGNLRNEVNLFQRKAENFIRLNFLGLVNQYLNEADVLIRGVEWGMLFKLKRLQFKGNLTWQNVLNNQDFLSGSFKEVFYEKEQLPNTPFLFGNLNTSFSIPSLTQKTSATIYYGINYVEEFFLGYEKIAKKAPKNIIPRQFINSLGITVSTKNKKHHINFEVKNLYNQIAFDNFNQQKPGRAFYFKYRFALDK